MNRCTCIMHVAGKLGLLSFRMTDIQTVLLMMKGHLPYHSTRIYCRIENICFIKVSLFSTSRYICVHLFRYLRLFTIDFYIK